MSQNHYITNVLFIKKNKWNKLNRNQNLKYNIDTKIELCILIIHMYYFDINHNYSEYLYNALINIDTIKMF